MKYVLVLTDEEGTVQDHLTIEVGGEDGYNLDKSMARSDLSGEVIDMIRRVEARRKK